MTDIVACERVHPLPDGELRLLGAHDCVTGAMTRVELGKSAVLVDCGVPQGRDAHDFVFPDAARDTSAVVLTHGHNDHVGSLPALLEGGYDGPLFGTAATLAVTRLSLEDALEMQRASTAEIRAFLTRFDALSRPFPYDVLREALPGISLAFREAGHILGSASVEVRSARSSALVSGDLGRPGAPILRDPNTTWDMARPFDVVVVETTYGSREHAHGHDDVLGDFEAILLDAVAKKSRVLVPSFAIGRTQTLLYYLNELVESGRVPAFPVALDTPMGLAVTDTYKRFSRLFDKESVEKMAHGDDDVLDWKTLFPIKHGRDSRKLADLPGPLLVIAGSGMCTGGRIVRHLVDGLPDPSTTVLFVGHQAEGTPGRRIQDAAKSGRGVRLDGEEVKVRARIATLKGLSAHADRKELLGWLSHLPTPRRLALHHGDREAQEAFAAYLGEQKFGQARG
jgi:metallo-beta-lactamase family protein